MSLAIDDVRRLAQLARIEVTDAESREVTAKLDAILALVGRLQAVDTTGIEPMAHAQDVSLPLREDRVTEPDQRAELLPLAPATAEGLYLVPKVIE